MRISDWSSDVCSSDLETHELKTQPAFELEELTQIYEARGLGRALAEQVAAQLLAHDALDRHFRDELGLTRDTPALPVPAAAASAAPFSFGAALPLLFFLLHPLRPLPCPVSTSVCLSVCYVFFGSFFFFFSLFFFFL